MPMTVEQITQQIAKLDGKSQCELLEQLPGVLKLPSAKSVWLKLAEEGYLARRRITEGIPLKRLPGPKEQRMHGLAERYARGELSKAEKEEYRRLADEVQQLALENAKIVARYLRPDLLDEKGEIRKPARRPRTARRIRP